MSRPCPVCERLENAKRLLAFMEGKVEALDDKIKQREKALEALEVKVTALTTVLGLAGGKS